MISDSRPDSENKHSRSRLDRENLLQYHDSENHVKQGQDLSHWRLRRVEILEAMERVMGPLPGTEKRCPLEMQIKNEQDCGDYLRQTIVYSSEPGCQTPAFLLIPKAVRQDNSPALPILALHSTSQQYGNQVAVGLHSLEGRNYGEELARRGYVVLAPAYPLMADYHPDLQALGYVSGTMKAIWDNIRGIDLLLSLPVVRGKFVGLIGHSLGGHNALFTAAHDVRISATVCSSGFDSFAEYMKGNLTGWTQQLYMPRLKSFTPDSTPFDFHEVIAAIAPRSLFISAPLYDANFDYHSVAKICKSAAKIYELYGKRENLQVNYPACDHDFPAEIRHAAYDFLARHL